MFNRPKYYKTRSGRIVGKRVEIDKVTLFILLVIVMAAVIIGGVAVN